MATLRDVKRLAVKFGAIIRDEKYGIGHDCCAEAPKNHVWCNDELHEFVAFAYRPSKPDYDDLIDRMSAGVRRCEEVDCEWCMGE